MISIPLIDQAACIFKVAGVDVADRNDLRGWLVKEALRLFVPCHPVPMHARLTRPLAGTGSAVGRAPKADERSISGSATPALRNLRLFG